MDKESGSIKGMLKDIEPFSMADLIGDLETANRNSDNMLYLSIGDGFRKIFVFPTSLDGQVEDDGKQRNITEHLVVTVDGHVRLIQVDTDKRGARRFSQTISNLILDSGRTNVAQNEGFINGSIIIKNYKIMPNCVIQNTPTHEGDEVYESRKSNYFARLVTVDEEKATAILAANIARIRTLSALSKMAKEANKNG